MGTAPFEDIDVETAKDFLKNTDALATGLLSEHSPPPTATRRCMTRPRTR